MKLKYATIAILTLAAGLVIVALLLDLGGSGSRSQNAAAGVSASVSDSTGSVTVSAAPQAPAATSQTGGQETPGGQAPPRQTQGQAPSPSPSAQPTRPSWDPQPTESDAGLEVPEPDEASKSKMPDSVERKPVLSKAPKTQVAEGKLTDGFPKDAVPLPESSVVVRSSVDKQGARVLVGVEGRTEESVEQVLDFYRGQFAQREWLISESTPLSGTTQLRGGFADDSTTVTIRQLPTGMTAVSAAGVFTVEE